jgi:3-hydroxyisobutyrate dehydrogenase-like beta-hydroxyacid dehydrogenase
VTPDDRAVGVVGLGAMGLGIATGLAAAGTTVRAHDAAPPARARAREAGIEVVDDLADLDCPVVILSLPTPAIVLEVIDAIAASGGSGVTVLDTSTVGPQAAVEAGGRMAEVGGRYADCPILGRPASVGSWTFPVGGAPDVVELATEVLAPLATRVVGVGPVGTASTTKVLNNLMLGTINAVTAELLVLAEAAGLDPGIWVDVIVDSGAASVSPLFRDVAARAVDGDFTPTFSSRLMHKDNALALDLAERLSVPMPTGHAAQMLNTMALAAGHGDEDSIAVIKPLEQLTGHVARRHHHE